MNAPFWWLRELLLACFGAEPVARFVDPLLGDVHAEHAAAAGRAERRRVWWRGLGLLARVLPSVMVRPTPSSFAALVLPLVALASLGILALAHDPASPRFVPLQATWLIIGVLAAAGLAYWSSRPGLYGASSASGVALLALSVAAVPGLSHAQAGHLYTARGMPLEPLKIALPFIVVGVMSAHHHVRALASALLASLAVIATARGAVGDACLGWTALAVLLDVHSRLTRLLAPLGSLLAWSCAEPPASGSAASHTDGILRIVLRHGGMLGVATAAGLMAWAVLSLRRGSTRQPQAARMLAFGFAASVALSLLAALGALHAVSPGIVGLSYGGSALFMLLGSAGALAGADLRATSE